MCFCKFCFFFCCFFAGGGRVLVETYAFVMPASRIIPGCVCVCLTPLECLIVSPTSLHAPSLHLTLFQVFMQVSQPSHDLNHFELYPQTCQPPLWGHCHYIIRSKFSILNLLWSISIVNVMYNRFIKVFPYLLRCSLSRLPGCITPPEEAALSQQSKPEPEGSKSGQSGKMFLLSTDIHDTI